MQSKVTFDLSWSNEPIIQAKISHTDDVRDKIAGKFKEEFGHESCLALVKYLPQAISDGFNTVFIELSPCDGWRNGSDKIAEHIPTIQILNLLEAFDKILKKREDVEYWKDVKIKHDKENYKADI